MKKILYALMIIGLSACQNAKNNTENSLKDSVVAVNDSTAKAIDNASACVWLKENVEGFFKKGDMNAMANLCTPAYYEYKMDATNVDLDLDGSLTESEFHAKYSKDYDTKLAGIGVGFLISGQDYGSITLSTCDVLHEDAESITLKSVISDCDYQTDYHREIVLAKEENSFKIKDVKEFD
ncbi:hypothetical protein [Sphingobacterium sp. CZ-2]|uniref:hypothetical protein n=1 Tax=Sphingobacterium sp. CZ-2 TaxID=2557994 RepID=UPI0010700EBA|nr:hypothetical protein [Sphingobacterium sp. CZ-2]QBR13125.1 hypothetical protein E3D81_13485 [Sphingobacterium sp. CZ-2]